MGAGRREAQPTLQESKGKEKWILQPARAQWFLNVVENADLAADPTTVLGREFKPKFRIPYCMFEVLLDATRPSGLFLDERKLQRGQKAHPLSMKLMAEFRRLAMGVPIDGLECTCGISDTRMRQFIEAWEPWFIANFHQKWVKMP